MPRPHAYLFALALCAACQSDETVTGYLDEATTFDLVQFNGAPVTASVTIDLGQAGQISGRAPCNRYSAKQTAPYPWIEIGPILSTKMACPDLNFESAYFESLAEATLAEVTGPVLILSNTDGLELVFQAAPER